MARRTISHVRKDLLAAFPEVEFTFNKTGSKGLHRISWTGGPGESDVLYAGGIGTGPAEVPARLWRQMTADELAAAQIRWAEEDAQREAERPAREAREAEERAQRRAAGAQKAAQTREAKRVRQAVLAAQFPRVAFTLAGERIEWTDGPQADQVADLAGVSIWHCKRLDTAEQRAEEARRAKRAAEWARRDAMTPEEVEADDAAQEAAQKAATRVQRRLEASRVRAVAIAAGRARRAALALHNPHLQNPALDPRQIALWDLLAVPPALEAPRDEIAEPVNLPPLFFISAAWPDVEFLVERLDGIEPPIDAIRWTGGPSVDDVRILSVGRVELLREPDGIEAEVLQVERDRRPLVSRRNPEMSGPAVSGGMPGAAGPFWVLGSRGLAAPCEISRETFEQAVTLARRRVGLNRCLEITHRAYDGPVLARLEERAQGPPELVLTPEGQVLLTP